MAAGLRGDFYNNNEKCLFIPIPQCPSFVPFFLSFFLSRSVSSVAVFCSEGKGGEEGTWKGEGGEGWGV